MGKEYFSHDYNARNDPKLQEVLMDIGLEGIGAYWCIVEMLYEQGGKLALKDCKSIAFSLHVSKDKDIIGKLINDYGLFEKDSESFWSTSVNGRIETRENISKKKSDAGKLGNAIRWGNRKCDKNTSQSDCTRIAPQSQGVSQSIAIKENKIKENKSIDNNIVCSSAQTITKTTIENRAETFYNALIPFVEKYGRKMIREFYDYWTEPNKSKTKMKFEQQPTWDLSRRLSRWANNNKQFNNGKQENGLQHGFFSECNIEGQVYGGAL